VVAVDTSDSARHAANWAADIAADWAVPLHLLHVPLGDAQDRPVLPVPRWLAELVDAAERAGAHPCTAEVQPGDVVATVAARSVGARMLVLGSYGEAAWSGRLAGAVTLDLASHVTCPVAVVRGVGPQVPPARSGPVVVGVDSSPAGGSALAFAADVATGLGTDLVAVQTRPVAAGEQQPVGEQDAARLLAEALEPVQADHPRLRVRARTASGTPLQALMHDASTARMLVVGTHGHLGATGMLTGSTSRALLESAPCTVVVVPAQRTTAHSALPDPRTGTRS
jgi:nucleotide-binding universal stress UspA family protein